MNWDAPDAPWATAEPVLFEIARIVGVPARRPDDHASVHAGTRTRYVENKRIDWRRVREIATLSEQAGQWTNFGPVSLALERVLEYLMALPAERAVVMCASATVALQALAALQVVKRGERLRWVVSAYTFFSQRTGAFAGATIVDCDDRGMIDMDAVAALPENTWDGLVVTNLFAGLSDARKLLEFCTSRHKALMLDSAAALFGLDRRSPDLPDEAVSFHHTKPWGVGEGGCMIVDRADASLARSVINFGIGGPDALKPLSCNGKISDLACAAILERLERLPTWASASAAQRGRIEALCLEMAVPLLREAPLNAILANVPTLAAEPIERNAFTGLSFDVGKYYPPLDERCGTARSIYSRIVNIPCHGDMAAVTNQELVRLLSRLRSTSAAVAARS